MKHWLEHMKWNHACYQKKICLCLKTPQFLCKSFFTFPSSAEWHGCKLLMMWQGRVHLLSLLLLLFLLLLGYRYACHNFPIYGFHSSSHSTRLESGHLDSGNSWTPTHCWDSYVKHKKQFHNYSGYLRNDLNLGKTDAYSLQIPLGNSSVPASECSKAPR